MYCVHSVGVGTYSVQCTLYVREFKHMWYQMYQADYCLKHLKLVFARVCPLPRVDDQPDDRTAEVHHNL